ncbi:MAG: flippase-like domain-containing protein, partial [Candidatus Saccharibacteria bacterium]|nr:flippase-like domain-containing protein [Candidatus Saccharibacteria bacterium]
MKQFLKRNWKSVLNAVTIVLLGVAIYLVRSDIFNALSDLAKINAIALFLMVPLQIQNYAAYAHMYQELLAMLGNKQPFKRLYKVSLELNFVNHVFPSGGVSGFSYFTARLKPFGVSTSQSTLTQTLRFMLVFASYVILLFVGLFLLALGGSASNMTILITCSMAFLTVFVIVVGSYIISDKKRIHNFTQTLAQYVNKVIHKLRPKHPETISLKRVEKVFHETHENYL